MRRNEEIARPKPGGLRAAVPVPVRLPSIVMNWYSIGDVDGFVPVLVHRVAVRPNVAILRGQLASEGTGQVESPQRWGLPDD